jgi:type IV pilus assembly protein PilN
MIRINLLPAHEVKQRLLLRSQVAVAMMLVVVSAIGCVWVMSLQGREKSGRLADLEQVEKEIASLESIVKEVQAFKTKRNQLNKQIEVVGGLKLNQRRPAPILDALSRSLPEQVWVISIQEQGTGIRITGKSLNGNVGIATFMENMGSSPWFGTAELIESKTELFLDRQVVSFTLTVPFEKPKSEQSTS